MNSADNEDSISTCANCGKKGDDVNNTCNKCKQVKYCNAACKKKHRSKHKKECEEHLRLAAKDAAELHDKKLFKQPPPKEDCPICFLQLPLEQSGYKYMSCCGKVICCGCLHAPVYDDQGNKVNKKKCPFCRTSAPRTEEEAVKRELKRVDANDSFAIYDLGVFYRDGLYGFPQDYTKSLELFLRAGELGYALAYNNVGYFYTYGDEYGDVVKVDKEKSRHYYELAAMEGNVKARYNLGVKEAREGNFDRSIKHFMIAVGSGCLTSTKRIKDFYSNGHATKEQYTKAIQTYQTYLGEIKSRQRDEAAAFSEDYRYYLV